MKSIPKITPLHDRVLIKRIDKDTESAGGIILTGSMTKDSTRGTVLAVGSGLVLENGEQRPLDLKVGDVVIFTLSFELKIELIKGDEYLIMREKDIVATIEV
ncbi:MAG: co-chaperone GroES [Psychromonas sp.]|nr:co-chaperone GroES [Psychromonas sp.]